MQDELSMRHTAIRMRLAGESVETICRTLRRSETWYYKWWRRYLEAGPTGLYDQTRGNRQVVKSDTTSYRASGPEQSVVVWLLDLHLRPAIVKLVQPRYGLS